MHEFQPLSSAEASDETEVRKAPPARPPTVPQSPITAAISVSPPTESEAASPEVSNTASEGNPFMSDDEEVVVQTPSPPPPAEPESSSDNRPPAAESAETPEPDRGSGNPFEEEDESVAVEPAVCASLTTQSPSSE